ncbi:MAG TPA: glucose 1-dehydrogenase [Thermodesulfobacteriota bacterium]
MSRGAAEGRRAAGHRPSLDFRGKVAVVTGASRGIGEAVARAFGAAGATVVLTARDPAPLAEVVRAVEEAGGRAEAVALDVADTGAAAGFADAVAARYGRIDVLVNNAGTSARETALAATEAVWDRLFATNLRGLFFLTRAVGRHMVARRSGAVVSIGSIAGRVGRREMAAYGATKAGVEQITRVLALEWAPHGVRVNAVAPGYVRTPLVEPVFARPGFLDEVHARTPLGRVAEPAEIAWPVLFLASDLASYVTGQTLCVDGGWTAE